MNVYGHRLLPLPSAFRSCTHILRSPSCAPSRNGSRGRTERVAIMVLTFASDNGEENRRSKPTKAFTEVDHDEPRRDQPPGLGINAAKAQSSIDLSLQRAMRQSSNRAVELLFSLTEMLLPLACEGPPSFSTLTGLSQFERLRTT